MNRAWLRRLCPILLAGRHDQENQGHGPDSGPVLSRGKPRTPYSGTLQRQRNPRLVHVLVRVNDSSPNFPRFSQQKSAAVLSAEC